MALTAKERMAKWRAKQRENPEAHQEYKQRERERNHRRRDKGEFKSVSQMTPREHRLAKSKWRKHSADYRQRKKAFTSLLTPPNSPDPNVEVIPQLAEDLKPAEGVAQGEEEMIEQSAIVQMLN